MTRDKDRRQSRQKFNGDNQREQVNISVLSGIFGHKGTQIGGVAAGIFVAIFTYADTRYTTVEKHTELSQQVSGIATTVHTLVGRLHRDRIQEVRHRIRVSDGWINRLKLINEADRTIYDQQALLAEISSKSELEGILKELINEKPSTD